ncbi:MAG: carboxypeptidase regulatory-like domain-containing protein [Desulfamplus sp.]
MKTVIRNNSLRLIEVTLFVVFCLILSSCKLTLTELIAPDSAGTGEVITITLNFAVTDHDDGATEQGIVLQIPQNWSVLDAKLNGNWTISEKTDYEQFYTPEANYKIWVGTIANNNSQHDSTFVTIYILTGNFSGVVGYTKSYSIKAATGASRNGSWIADDPEGIFDFANINDMVHQKSISITKQEDNDTPEDVNSLVLLTSSDICSPDISIDWSGYNESGQKDVVKYNIYKSSVYTTNSDEMNLIKSVNHGTYSFYINDLTPGENYFFAVTAVDELFHENKVVTPISYTVPYSSDINGIVTDSTGKRLKFITVLLTRAGQNIQNIVTDEEGRFSFRYLCNDSYQIEAGGVGYGVQTRSVYVDTTIPLYKVNFNLVPAPINYYILNSDANYICKLGTATYIYGSNGVNKVTLERGAAAKLINFPGNNEITIQSSYGEFTVSRSGAAVTFEDIYGTILTIPATKTTQKVIFYDKILTFVINNNKVMLGNQEVTLNSSPIL